MNFINYYLSLLLFYFIIIYIYNLLFFLVKTQFVSRNMDPLIAKHFGEIMESTGSLINIKHKEITVPIGSWGGNLGKCTTKL
jgi:hypothetical protein